MNSPVKLLVSLCTIGFIVSGPALAESATVSISISEDNCILISDLSASDGELVTERGDRRRVISANNENGNANYSCSADLDPTESGRSEVYNQERVFELTGIVIRCDLPGYDSTDDWHQVISRSGKAKLSCHF
jgi:hypothetical protein